ncbi:MAG: glucose-1-phosphate adenylyltransferase [Gemmatimonadota bacterium]|nr:glucose-1-phosphate adenylyltransferase [Gemmatimonadota bacterium]
MIMKQTLAVILGGGRGTRLAPLTYARCKPAINLAGKFRLIDIPVSNCINSGLTKIFVVTQFLSTGLHRHIFQSYRFDRFSEGFLQVLAAEQTPANINWFQGTADAIRQSLHYLNEWNIDYVVILSGDQLYSMDYHKLIEHHIEMLADVTVCTLPVGPEEVSRMGIMQIGNGGKIEKFVEKPQDAQAQESLATSEDFLKSYGIEPRGRRHLASMGVYVFNRDVLIDLLANEEHIDFGREVIPEAVETFHTFAYVFDGFWEDIGTIESYYKANLSLTDPVPPFNFYKEDWPIYTHPRSLPGVKVNGGKIEKSIMCEGSIIENAEVTRSIIGIRQVIGAGTRIRDSLILGADYYGGGPSPDTFRKSRSSVPLGIGQDVQIEGAIVDKNACIGDGVVISPKSGQQDQDGDGFYVRNGIVIIPRGAVIKPGRVI